VTTDGRHAEVAFGASLDDDLARRDFTINAIAYHPLKHEWRDLFEGTEDLDRKVIRAVGSPAERFREDYLRILRAIRFCARLGFTIDRATWEAAKEESEGLRGLSAERVRDEWFKGLRTARSVTRLVKLWTSIGAASIWLPELLKGEGDAVERTGAESTAGRDPVVLTTLVCVDPMAVLQRLKASDQEIGRAVALMAGPHEPEGVGPVATRRWLSAVGDAADDLVALWEARNRAQFSWAGTVREIRERGDPLTRGDLAIGGNELVEMGVTAGPEVGAILEQLLWAVVDEPGLNTREQLVGMVEKGRRA
jgi:tRNA nucleotidyltransferase (CCA-adding enzyme)